MTAAKKTAPKKAAPKKVAAAKAEVNEDRKPTYFTHEGTEFRVPHPLDFPLELLETDNEIEAIRLILGEDQWATYKATNPTVGDFYELSKAMSEAQGRDDDSGN